MNSDSIEITGFRPGALGRVVEMHGAYYATVWGLDRRFEAEVAREMAAFMTAFDDERDGFWLACRGEDIIGSITLDGSDAESGRARIRWFIVDAEAQGHGVGQRLLDRALDFARARHPAGITLWTFAGLDAARRLYEARGFRLVKERFDRDWNREGVTHQEFVLDWTREDGRDGR